MRARPRRRRADADRGRDHAHARPRRPRRHALRAARSCSRTGQKRDPIDRYEKKLGATTASSVEEIRAAVKDELERETEWALAAADARPGDGARGRVRHLATRAGRRQRRPGRAGSEEAARCLSSPTCEAISDGLREEMRADETVFCLGEDIGAFGGAFKVTDGFIEEFGAERVLGHAARRERDHRRRRRGRGRGSAAGLRDAVRGLHRVRLRPARERRGEDALPPGAGRADGRAAAVGRRLLRRAVPLPEPGGLVHAGAGPEGRGAVHRRRTPRGCWPRRSATPTRSSTSSTSTSTGA